MPSAIDEPITLSICITTFNRAAFIGETFESILDQLSNNCELVVLDGGSTDGTERVVSQYACRFGRLRYFRQEVNNGFDRDCDRLVELARGEYCLLMSDDDLLKQGTVAAILEVLRRDLSLVIVNVESRDFHMQRVLQDRWLDLATNRVYKPGEMDRLFADLGERLQYVPGVVIRRSIWIAREKGRYYDSWFIFVGIIFQERLPGEALVMADPLIIRRTSNQRSWTSRMIEIEWIKWPSIVWSLGVSESAKGRVCSREPWREARELLIFRGLGYYSITEYRRWIRPKMRSALKPLTPALVALLPGVLVNSFLVFYYSLARYPHQGWRHPDLLLQGLRNSRFHFRNWFVFRLPPLLRGS